MMETPVKSTKEVPNTEIVQDSLNEHAELLLVRNTRIMINKKLMTNGLVPDDSEKLDFLMRNLKDMDASALTRSRIKSDEKNANNDAITVGMVTNVLQALRGGKALPPMDITDVDISKIDVPMLPESLSPVSLVPGETQIGSVSEDVDTFKARMNRQLGTN